MDNDFIVTHDCMGRLWMSGWRKRFADAACKYTGHLLWRVLGSVYHKPDGHTLDLQASYCRRCFKGGYVQGDYIRN
jgi:hypothetical protein